MNYSEIYSLIVEMERSIMKATDRAKGNQRACEEILEILQDYANNLQKAMGEQNQNASSNA